MTNLVQSINKQKKFGKMVKYSLTCMTKLAVDTASIEDLIDSGAMESAMGAMDALKDDEDSCVAVNGLIQASTVNPDLTAQVCKKMKGKFGGFVHSLKTHVAEDTLVSSCKTIAALSADPQGRAGLDEVGGIEALSDCLKSHPNNPDMLRAGALALANFSKDPRYAQKIMDSGALDLILKAMKQFPNDPSLIEAAALLISNLAKASPEFAERLKAMGAMDRLVEALENHPYNDAILQASQEALAHLAGETEINNALSQLTRGTTTADVKTAKAVSTLAALTLVGDNVDYLHRNQGVEAVLSTMKGLLGENSREAKGIMTGGARFLTHMGTDEQKRYAIMKAGGVRMEQAALQAYLSDPIVAEAAIQAMAGNMSRKDNALYVAKIGGLESCLAAIEAHPLNVPVNKAALNFLQGMAKFPESADVLVAGKGVEGVVKILKNHMKNPDLVVSAMNVLQEIGKQEKGRLAIIDAGALPLLVQAINEHPDNPDVIKSAMRAMAEALKSKESAEILRRAGAIDAISAALDRFPGDKELQDLGKKLLKMLTADEQEIKEAVKKAEVKRERLEDLEAKRKRAEQELIDAEFAHNQSLWEIEEEKRKKEEAERVRAFEEMKRREWELQNMKFSDETDQARERKLEIERKHQEIIAKRDRIQKERDQNVEKHFEKKKKHREEVSKAAFKRFEEIAAKKPDVASLQRKARLKKALADKPADSDSDSDYET